MKGVAALPEEEKAALRQVKRKAPPQEAYHKGTTYPGYAAWVDKDLGDVPDILRMIRLVGDDIPTLDRLGRNDWPSVNPASKGQLRLPERPSPPPAQQLFWNERHHQPTLDSDAMPCSFMQVATEVEAEIILVPEPLDPIGRRRC